MLGDWAKPILLKGIWLSECSRQNWYDYNWYEMLIGIFVISKISAEFEKQHTNLDLGTLSDGTIQRSIPSKRWRNGSRPEVILHFPSLFLQQVSSTLAFNMLKCVCLRRWRVSFFSWSICFFNHTLNWWSFLQELLLFIGFRTLLSHSYTFTCLQIVWTCTGLLAF